MIAVVSPSRTSTSGRAQVGHEALHERAVGLVDQPLRLRGDRVEHQRALARAGDAGEHRQPALRQFDVDVFEVVLARTGHPDQVMAVGDCVLLMPRLPLAPVLARTSLRSSLALVFGRSGQLLDADGVACGIAEGAVADPYGWSVGSCMTSAPLACARSNTASRSVVASMMLA